MKNKTCGECKYRYSYRYDEDCDGRCKLFPTARIPSNKPSCSKYEPIPPPTNIDRIRNGSNRELAEIFDDIYNGNKCRYCINNISGNCKFEDKHAEYDEGGWIEDEDCISGFEAWLDSPAESKESEG